VVELVKQGLGQFAIFSYFRLGRSRQARSTCQNAFANTHEAIRGALKAHPCALKVCESVLADSPCRQELLDKYQKS